MKANNNQEDDPFVDDIPGQFQSRFGETFFGECNFCSQKFTGGKGYMINKIYEEGACVYELAYCMDCRGSLQATFSAKSTEVAKDFFPGEDVLRERRLPIMLLGTNKCGQLTSYCIKCKADRNNTPNYHDYAYCKDDKLVYGFYPYMICESCELELYNALSSETIQAYQDFMKKHFGLPPDSYSKKDKKSILFI
jgi:hypothetical protein